MNFSKKWKKAFSLLAFKKDNPDIIIIEEGGEYWYKGVLLQEKKDGSFYYKDVLYKVKC